MEPRSNAFPNLFDEDKREDAVDLIRVCCGEKTTAFHKTCFAQLKGVKADAWPKCPFCA